MVATFLMRFDVATGSERLQDVRINARESVIYGREKFRHIPLGYRSLHGS
jgi:hypothetical protein